MKIDKVKFYAACANSNLTYFEVAKKAGVSRNTIISVNRGRNVNSKTLGRLTKVLNIEPLELVLKEGV